MLIVVKRSGQLWMVTQRENHGGDGLARTAQRLRAVMDGLREGKSCFVCV